MFKRGPSIFRYIFKVNLKVIHVDELFVINLVLESFEINKELENISLQMLLF